MFSIILFLEREDHIVSKFTLKDKFRFFKIPINGA